jgi:heme-degrading monooxygenase HmoA
MFVRLTFLYVDQKDARDVSAIYQNEVLPALREFKGLEEAMLLEPTDSGEEFISFTAWASKADADQYENSGTYRRLVDLFKEKYTKKPVLKTYQTQESKQPAM